jgi:hypothetical protein
VFYYHSYSFYCQLVERYMGNCRSRASTTRTAAAAPRRTPQQLRRLWQAVTRRVVRLLLIRRRWAATGLALQAPSLVDTFDGLERVKGRLQRPKRGRRPSRP